MSVVVSNLDFEYAWAAIEAGRHWQAPKAVQSVVERWSHILKVVAPEAAVMRWPEGEVDASGQGRAVAWGWTPAVVKALEKAGRDVEHPPLEVVREVNSKCASHRLEQHLGVAMEGACVVSDKEGLSEGIEEIDGPWVLKHPWGVAGRQQRRGEGGVDEAVLGWATRWWDVGGQMVLEPLIEVEEEWSLHFEIDEDGVEEVGAAKLLCDGDGTFRGVSVGAVELAKGALEAGWRAAEWVADRGYRGPVGIDGMAGERRRSQGISQGVMRPVTEINGRWSFGRLALEIFERYGENREAMGWLHPVAGAKPTVPGEVERLPEEIDPEGRSGSWLYWSSSTG